jgi:hypothetical protein
MSVAVRPAARQLGRTLALATALAGAPLAPGSATAGPPAWLHYGDLGAPAPVEVPAGPVAPSASSHGAEDLLVRYEVWLGRDGVVDERELHVRRYLTHEGVEQSSDFEVSARAGFEDVTIERAYVEDAAGGRLPVDPDTVQVRPSSQSDVYSDVSSVVVPMPSVAPGSTAVFEARSRLRAREWPLPWSRVLVAQETLPIQRFEVSVGWDASVTPPVWKTDAPGLACHAEGARRIRCTAGPIDAFAVDPDLTAVADLAPLLVFGAPMSWPQLVEQYARLLEERTRPDPVVRETAARLVAGETSLEGRLHRIQHFVATEVRYLALEYGESAVLPNPPAQVLARRYGDCKDHVALFVALARALGIDAHATLVATQVSDPAKMIVPSWHLFDHMIACAPMPGGRPACFDLTAPDVPAGELPPGVEGRVALDLAPGTQAPRVLERARYVWQISVHSELEIRCDGSLHEALARSFRGPGAALLRAGLRSLSDADRRIFLQNEYRRLLGDRVEPVFSIENLEQPGQPLVLRSTTDFPASSALRPNWYNDADGWVVYYARDLRTANQHHPYRFPGIRYHAEARYSACAAAHIGMLGPQLDFRARFGTLERHYQAGRGTVLVATDLDMPRRQVDGGERDALNRFIEGVLAQTRIWFALGWDPASPPAAAAPPAAAGKAGS